MSNTLDVRSRRDAFHLASLPLGGRLLPEDADEPIGLFVGAVLSVLDIFHCTATLEDTTFEDISNYLCRESDRHFLDLRPKDLIRIDAAKYMSFNETTFLFGHELGHVADAHLPFLTQMLDIDFLYEYNAHHNARFSGHTRQMLEFGADRHGARVSLNT